MRFTMLVTPRRGYLLGFLACAALIGFALYLQYFQNEEPCPLCIFQRVAFMALGVVFLVAALHGPARVGAAVYGSVLLLVAAAGAAIAARHVWLQYLPRHMVPECGPDLAYLTYLGNTTGSMRPVVSETRATLVTA